MVATNRSYGATLERTDSQQDRHLPSDSKRDMNMDMKMKMRMATYQTETNVSIGADVGTSASRNNMKQNALEIEGGGQSIEALRDGTNEDEMEFSHENNDERDENNSINGRGNNGDEDEVQEDSSSTSAEIEIETETETETERSFYEHLMESKGPGSIIFLCMTYALAAGSTIGVIPAVMTDQFARMNHSFDIEFQSCSDYNRFDQPQACIDGNSDAQTAAASASFISNTLTFLTSSLVGSITDQHGRRLALIIASFLTCLGPFALVLIQMYPLSINPNWYYVSSSTTGLVSWISIALSALSDSMPKQWRSTMFGLLLSGFSLGFALSPVLALGFSHYGVSILSFSLLFFGGVVYSILFLPETLSKEAIVAARRVRAEQDEEERISRRERGSDGLYANSYVQILVSGVMRPFKELSILNRNAFFRLLSSLAFFSGMSISADQTLLIYYVENRLGFTDADVAQMFGIIGLLGLVVQGFFLKIFTDFMGERLVIVGAFICGIITNILYAFAPSKALILVAVTISSFGAMSFPTISAVKANNVEECEQGRIQGALYALSSLASAVGPFLLRAAYQKTKDTKYPGSFFLVASAFFFVATLCSWALPKDKTNSVKRNRGQSSEASVELMEDAESRLRQEQSAPLL